MANSRVSATQSHQCDNDTPTHGRTASDMMNVDLPPLLKISTDGRHTQEFHRNPGRIIEMLQSVVSVTNVYFDSGSLSRMTPDHAYTACLPSPIYRTSCLKRQCDPYIYGTTVQYIKVIVQWKLRSCGARGITYSPNKCSVSYGSTVNNIMCTLLRYEKYRWYTLSVHPILRVFWQTCGAYMQGTCCVSCLNHFIPLYIWHRCSV